MTRAAATNLRAPLSRWDTAEAKGPYASAAYGAFVVHGVFTSDAGAFGISRTEARGLDPIVTLVLQTGYGMFLASLPSSKRRQSLSHAPVGFFLGVGGSISGQGGDGASHGNSVETGPAAYSGTSGALSVLSGRVSFSLGLTGPCLTVDTACSSALVAAHLAVSALKLVECPWAVMAGACILTGLVTATFSAAGMLSALGRSHSFNRRADGYCRGEGCGAFLLRPGLNEADIAVRGSAVQQDGPSASLTAPNGSS